MKRGEVLAADDGRLIGMITPDSLNTIVKSGSNAGLSPFYWISSSADGQAY